jgi:hypothetical protein
MLGASWRIYRRRISGRLALRLVAEGEDRSATGRLVPPWHPRRLLLSVNELGRLLRLSKGSGDRHEEGGRDEGI